MTSEILASWQHAWRAIEPAITTAGLQALHDALVRDDPRLIQNATLEPCPLKWNDHNEPTAACPLAWTGWQGDGLKLIFEVQEYFTRLLKTCDEALGYRYASAQFVNYWDDVPRQEARRALTMEVSRALTRRLSEGRDG